MKIFEVTNPPYLFHVTFTKNVSRIKETGLLQFEPSNWVSGEGGERYNKEAGIFAFTHPKMLLNGHLKCNGIWKIKISQLFD